MCLSRVYREKRDENDLVAEEVTRVIYDNGTIRIKTILGEEKELEDYFIKEVNLSENYLVLREKGDE